MLVWMLFVWYLEDVNSIALVQLHWMHVLLLVKIYKNVLPRNRILIATVCGETYFKNDVEKPATNVKYWPHKLKGERWERERDIKHNTHSSKKKK